MSRLLTGLTSGMIAGAAGSTALNAFTYTQQALNGQPSGATPDQAAQAVIQSVGAEVPGTPDKKAARLEGLGPLSGLGVGLGLGALGGLLRAFGVKIPIGAAPVVLGLGAMAISDGVMTAVGITDPRSWTPKSVVQDGVPHLVYGAVTVLALHRMIDPDTMQVR
ncbi:MAG: hypothetical protein H7323_12885 [Frankiales bacterium]|nr:hypothetical protein [Frankiales bacterium]